ncbi:uncharacterized protein BP01DRAFT_361549 [Aspergillus saccharolyticus JOP 1030-1]|uniref:Sodium/calcium exchanger membrane region domain-containing protein n=1 Tax=Aspergillus saccharolyticus JOP 1030-1 TaxID=1450539 RepID=A0A318Z8W3_9EURO|nr:hypothetical protein BP01DRAFT_361549 [Aspergillus saccharolyticus JOP 1030-1]PYH40080.1 hypothetical protein BP01DRAFT_361549 [Aspergillus saccharolyticus JOP 1030-1]
MAQVLIISLLVFLVDALLATNVLAAFLHGSDTNIEAQLATSAGLLTNIIPLISAATFGGKLQATTVSVALSTTTNPTPSYHVSISPHREDHVNYFQGHRLQKLSPSCLCLGYTGKQSTRTINRWICCRKPSATRGRKTKQGYKPF